MQVAHAIGSKSPDPRLPIQALHVALGRAYIHIQSAGRIEPEGLVLLQAIFDAMVNVWATAEVWDSWTTVVT